MPTNASRIAGPDKMPFGVVGAAVADAEEVGDLDRRKFVDAVGLVGAEHVVRNSRISGS